MAVVVLPTPPFWLTMARTVVVVAVNILGSALVADAISGAIPGDCSLCLRGWLSRLLRGADSLPPSFGGPPCPGAAPPPPRTLLANLDVRSRARNPAC